jgi:signal transduction histidine kinase/CheY-like chemotaxis protein
MTTACGRAGDVMTGLPEGPDGTGTPPDFRWLFESAPACLVVLDPGFQVVAASDAYLQVCGIARADAIGKEIFGIVRESQAFPGPDAVAGLRKSLARVLRDGVPDAMPVRSFIAERPAAKRGGVAGSGPAEGGVAGSGPAESGVAESGPAEIRYWSSVNVPILDQGRVGWIIHRIEDVTGHVRHGADAAQQDRPAEEDRPDTPAVGEVKAEFASRLSRELRAPLNTILGFGELLALDDLSDEQREKASLMVKAARQVKGVMDGILDISRMEDRELSLSVEAVPATAAVASALDLIRPQAGSQGVRLDPPPQSGLIVCADRQRLRQVLLNLLSNSVKYNHPGGKVTVTVASRPGERVRISVTDTGRGIPEADLTRLFTPFQRLDAAEAGIEGTGLGLALCRRLVTAMGGSAGVTSTQGLGSTFWVELPAAKPAEISTPTTRPAPAGVRAYPSPKTLLYVEDMVENLQLIEHILRRRPSVRLVPAMLGGVALDLATEHHPDVILLDLHLPDMSGEELLRRFQADPATSRTPVVILSADAAEAQRTRLLGAGAAAYVTKPIGVRAFLETVDRLVGQAPLWAGVSAAEDGHDAARDTGSGMGDDEAS